MQTMLYDATRYRRWLIAAASAALLVGCGGPYAWNDYIDPGYTSQASSLISPSTEPAEVTGAVSGISSDELRSAVAQATENRGVALASTSASALQGSSAPSDPATRTVWAFSSAPASNGAGSEVRVVATYYFNNNVFSVAEGKGVVSGADDPRLRQLIASVASALVPLVQHGGGRS